MSAEALDIDLTDDEYTVKQSLVRNKYRVYDERGDPVLRGKQKLLKMKEEFPFTDPDGEPVFSVKAKGIVDIAGDYVLVDAGTEEPIAVLDKNFTLYKHVWKIRDPEDERLLATVESRSAIVEFLRSYSSLFSLFPHRYSITDAEGAEVGEIQGAFSLKDRYAIRVGDTGSIPRPAIVAAAIAIDALEGN